MQHKENVLNIEKDELVKEEDKKEDKIIPTLIESTKEVVDKELIVNEISERTIE